MDTTSITTKVQVNISDDPEIYRILAQVSKRKRACMLRKMLTEYVHLKGALIPRKTPGRKPVPAQVKTIPKCTQDTGELNRQAKRNRELREQQEEINYLIASIFN